MDHYVTLLLEARRGKNITPETARDALANDVNMFGVMMVASGDAAGMVSGSIHTTAATIRPAMQVCDLTAHPCAHVTTQLLAHTPHRAHRMHARLSAGQRPRLCSFFSRHAAMYTGC